MKKFLVIFFCLVLLLTAQNLANPITASAQVATFTVDGPDGSGVTVWPDYKAIDVTCSKDFLWLPLYSSLPEKYTNHMSINDIPLADRIAKETYLNIGDCSGLYGNAVSFSVLAPNKFRIFYTGGGLGDLDPNGTNTLVLDKNFPVGANVLGEDIVIQMDPVTDSWSVLPDITFWVADPNSTGVSTWSGISYKAIDIHSSRSFTSGVYGATVGSEITDHITINGIPLADRIAKASYLNIGDTSDLYGNAAVANVLSPTSIRIYYCGGGLGDIDPNINNVVEFDKDFPVGYVTLGKSISIGMDTATKTWSELPELRFWVTDPNNTGVSTWGGVSYKAIDIHSSRPFTSGVYGATVGSEITDHIIINGISLADRIAKASYLNIGDTSDLYGNAAVVNVLSPTSIRVYYCGGGLGDLNPAQKNTVVLDATFPVGFQVTGKMLSVAMDPVTKQWSPHIPVGSTTMTDDVQSHIDAQNSNYIIPATVELLDENDGWYRGGTVLTGFFSLYQPEVVYVEGEEYPYRMYFFGWAFNELNDPEDLGGGVTYPGYPGGDAIFMARGKNLNEWEVYSRANKGSGEVYWDTTGNAADWVPVLVCGNEVYDNFHVGDPSIVYQNGIYYMAYSAMGLDVYNPNEPNPWDDAASSIMGAVSVDGINWVTSNGPILMWEHEIGMDERVTRSAENDTFFGMYQRPSLMYDDGKWKIWFDYWAGYNSGNGTSIGYAENEGDFMNPEDWVVITGDTTPVKSQFVDIDVVKIGDIYYAYGDPFLYAQGIYDSSIANEDPSWSLRQIVEMQSYDGINWTVTGYFRPDPGYPTNQIPQVFLDHKTGNVCIFYANQQGMEGGVYNWHWKTINYMYRSIESFNTD